MIYVIIYAIYNICEYVLYIKYMWIYVIHVKNIYSLAMD